VSSVVKAFLVVRILSAFSPSSDVTGFFFVNPVSSVVKASLVVRILSAFSPSSDVTGFSFVNLRVLCG
jgi:hypothetical protein